MDHMTPVILLTPERSYQGTCMIASSRSIQLVPPRIYFLPGLKSWYGPLGTGARTGVYRCWLRTAWQTISKCLYPRRVFSMLLGLLKYQAARGGQFKSPHRRMAA